jgi:hypothetical protein
MKALILAMLPNMLSLQCQLLSKGQCFNLMSSFSGSDFASTLKVTITQKKFKKAAHQTPLEEKFH